MVYHAENSTGFLGLRTVAGGRKQIVCETKDGRRILLNVCDPSTSDTALDEALRQGICNRHVLRGLLAALQDRSIAFDLVG